MLFKYLLVLWVAILFYWKNQVFQVFDEIFKRYPQMDQCKKWCNSEGYLIKFSKDEKSHCEWKCIKFTFVPPVVDMCCNLGCGYPDLIFGSKYCSKSDFCKYYQDINAMDVKNSVKVRWMQALTSKIFKN